MLIAIERFDALIHPDYASTIYISSPKEAELRKSWDRRVGLLAIRDDSVLLYHSAFPFDPRCSDEQGDNYPKDAVTRELERREKYGSLLRERFFLYGMIDMPNSAGLRYELAERGFTYNPDRAKLTAYGEYYEYCVEAWMRTIQHSLGLGNKNCKKELSLSL